VQLGAGRQACPITIVKATIAFGALALPVVQQCLDQVQALGDHGVLPGVRAALAERFALVVEAHHIDIQWRVAEALGGEPAGQLAASQLVRARQVVQGLAHQVEVGCR